MEVSTGIPAHPIGFGEDLYYAICVYYYALCVRKISSSALFGSKVRQGVLAATLLDPERSWYLSDLARHLDVRPSTLQRKLAGLTGAGVLSRREEGNRTYYRADTTCPVFAELRGLLLKTAGLHDVVRRQPCRSCGPHRRGLSLRFHRAGRGAFRERRRRHDRRAESGSRSWCLHSSRPKSSLDAPSIRPFTRRTSLR